MTNTEKAAFVNAYCNHIAHLPHDTVTDFVEKYFSNEAVDYSGDFVPIVDALGIWLEATKFILINRSTT